MEALPPAKAARNVIIAITVMSALFATESVFTTRRSGTGALLLIALQTVKTKSMGNLANLFIDLQSPFSENEASRETELIHQIQIVGGDND